MFTNHHGKLLIKIEIPREMRFEAGIWLVLLNPAMIIGVMPKPLA